MKIEKNGENIPFEKIETYGELYLYFIKSKTHYKVGISKHLKLRLSVHLAQHGMDELVHLFKGSEEEIRLAEKYIKIEFSKRLSKKALKEKDVEFFTLDISKTECFRYLTKGFERLV